MIEDLRKFINNEMDETTKVLRATFNVDYDIPCGMMDDEQIYIWSNDVKNNLNIVMDEVIVQGLLMVYLPDIDFSDREVYKDLSFTIKTILDNNECNDEERIENLKLLKSLYDNYKLTYNNKKLTYTEYLNILIKLEEYVNKIGLYLILDSYSSPLECRHNEELDPDNFNFSNLKSNFPNFKEWEEE